MNRPIPNTLLTITGIHSRTPRVRSDGKSDYSYVYKAVCVCGNETTVRDHRTTGKKKKISCGKHSRSKLAEMQRHPNVKKGFARPSLDKIREVRDYGGNATEHYLYRAWVGIIHRCENQSSPIYKNYGGRGITVDPLWKENFWAFVATIGERPEGHTLGRIDNDGPYSPENCRWETPRTQAQNTRRTVFGTFNGVTKSIPDWAVEYGVKAAQINTALNLGVPFKVLMAYMVKR